MAIQYFKTRQYGNPVMIMIESPEATALKSLTQRKLLTASDIQICSALGIQFTEVLPKI